MMGIPISGGSCVYGDNVSVIHYTSKPESTLQNKCNAIAYHAIGKSVVMGKTVTGHLRSEDNPADLLTMLVNRQKRRHLASLVLYDIYEKDT